ncbi:cytochrome-c peroxidase [Chitinophaga niabensis]|nr:cytochrome c peroxidase [Chitinophaga niabensis]
MANHPLIKALLVCLIWCSSCREARKETFDSRVHIWLYAQADSLEASANQLLQLSGDTTALRQAFADCRKRYKKLEWFSEYYAPATSRLLNGPPLPEIEVEENKKAEPSGLQVIEELIYPYNMNDSTTLHSEIRSFISGLIPLRHTIENTQFDTAHVLDACRLEVFRVIILGLSGFDTPLSGLGISESAASLDAVAQMMSLMGVDMRADFDRPIAIARQHTAQSQFDYAGFITTELNPLTRKMMSKGLPLVKEQTAVRNDAATLFDSAAINISFFVHATEALPTAEKVSLGQALFFNDQLAGNGKRSCQSCHQPGKAFTDGLNQSLTLNGTATILRNTPTLMYAGFQHAQFYDMRSPTLENQVMDVLNNKDEMHSSPEKVAAWLNKMPEMKDRFRKAFPQMKDSIQSRQVMMAIASYVRELHPFSSAFDRYMRGDQQAMSDTAKRGFNLFMGKARCATCHFIPLFNGTAGPAFTNTESEVLGVLSKPGIASLDKDPGRFTHTQIEELNFSFKTPTLRNIALTAPYMHNGAYRTLEEVMDFYDKGGAAGYGIQLGNQTLSPDPLHLTQKEKQEIIAFMKALND